MRRQLAHQAKGLTRTSVRGHMTQLRNALHYHACVDCRRVFDDACSTPEVNGRCHGCRGSIVPAWAEVRDPKPCCVDNCAQVTTVDDLIRFQLAGPGPWFKCNTCARCHGSAPTTLTHKENR